MKYFIFLMLALLPFGYVKAQPGADPALDNLQLLPNMPSDVGDPFDISCSIGNSGAVAITGADDAHKMGFTLLLGKCAPSPLGTGTAAVTGSALAYFDIGWDAGSNSFIGVQKANMAIPPLTQLSLEVSVEVTALSLSDLVNDIGAVLNIQPAVASNPQPVGNDFRAVFTHSLSLTPLPLALKSFDAVSTGCSGNISFETATEAGMASFDLQQQVDNTGWQTVRKIAAKGMASAYEANLPLIENKLNYVRLKINAKDGKSGYSEVKMLRCNTNPLITIHPNPVRQMLAVEGLTAKSQLQLFDSRGRQVLSAVAEGRYEMNMGRLAAGMYVLMVRVNGEVVGRFRVVRE